MTTELLPCQTTCDKAKRCSDYDEDCAQVLDHLRCWTGGCFVLEGEVIEWDRADGYCPYLIGMER